jgi:hypothetical protein
MALETVREAYNSEPFRPFVICLADDRTIPVYDRDSIMMPTGGRTIVIRQPDGGFEIIESDSVVSVEVAKNSNETSKRSKPVTIEQIKRLYEAQPFQPFVIHLASGREVAVPHREFMWAAPSGRTIFVELPDESVDIIDLLLVTDVVRMPANGARKKKGR